MTRSIIVQKFGGSSVADCARIKSVAGFIKSCLQSDMKIVVVVSAMGHTTNELIALAHEVSAEPPKRELDMLISCGERSSMALLAMALNDIGVRALSLTGSQSGIITDEKHSGAEIIAIKPQRVLEAFTNYDVVIIAGFQGVSEQREITTLRRGGSDTTAVAMAAAINASMCEIYTDVAGVMDCDPRIVVNATMLPTISFATMESMALYGARVLAHDAIRIAREFGVTLRIAKTGDAQHGTQIGRVSLKHAEKPRIALTHLRACLRVVMPPSLFATIKHDANYFLCGSLRDTMMVAYVSNDLSQELREMPSNIDAKLALITLHVRCNQEAFSILSRVFDLMNQHDITCEDLIMNGAEIFIVVKDEELSRALTIFHEGLLQMESHP